MNSPPLSFGRPDMTLAKCKLRHPG